jgi:hypothetical protein
MSEQSDAERGINIKLNLACGHTVLNQNYLEHIHSCKEYIALTKKLIANRAGMF